MPSKITFNNSINTSVQIGDTLIWMETAPSTVGGFTVSLQTPSNVGIITQVGQKHVIVDTDPALLPQITNLVNNGTFDADIAGWTVKPGAASFTNAYWINTQVMQIHAGPGDHGVMTQDVIGLTIGESYTFSYECTGGSRNFAHLYDTGGLIQSNIGSNVVGIHTHVFTANTTSISIHLGVIDGSHANFDNVSLVSNEIDNFWGFVKNQNANLSGVKGGYMEVTLKNDQTAQGTTTELFSVNSTVSTNSK